MVSFYYRSAPGETIVLFFSTPYIDRSQPLTNKLYITNIQPKHAGTYYCTSVVGGNQQEVMIILNLNGMHYETLLMTL
jgi:hypothetical protein